MSIHVSRLMLPAAAAAAFVASPASAAIELLIDPAAGGALSLRATGDSPESINGYNLVSAGGFLADLGDETLGGQLTPLFFDVDNVGSDEVAFFTVALTDPLSVLPPVSVPNTGDGLALNLAWTGGSADPLADLTFLYGPVGLVEPGPDPDPILELPGEIVVLVDAGIVGDYDDSGQVEQGDLNLVLNNWGQPAPFTPNGDPFTTPNVDQEELNRVLNNWGSTGSSPDFSGLSVPEPGLATAGVAFLFVGAGLRRRAVKSS